MNLNRIKSEIADLADGLLFLLFPELCVACEKALNSGEKCICTSCRFRLPKTNYHLKEDNPVVKHFWGKVKIEAATAYYHFGKGEKIQRMIHQLKYKGRSDIGLVIGELFAYQIMNTYPYSSIDVVVAVPLHKKRLQQRGYNQSDSIAEGIAKAFALPFYPNALKRVLSTSTQTKKHRFERYENMLGVFEINEPEKILNKHVFLVDDVITTGSTLIACAELLLQNEGTRVSIGSLAHA